MDQRDVPNDRSREADEPRDKAATGGRPGEMPEIPDEVQATGSTTETDGDDEPVEAEVGGEGVADVVAKADVEGQETDEIEDEGLGEKREAA